MDLREKKFKAEAIVLAELGLVRHKINGIHNFYCANSDIAIGDVSKCLSLIKGRLANCVNKEGKLMSEAEIVDFINKESYYKNRFAVLSIRINILDKCGITNDVILLHQ